MDRKTILNNEIAKNEQKIKHNYRVFWLLQAVAALLLSEEFMLLIFIAFLPHFQDIGKMRKENDLIRKKFKHLLND